MTTELQQVIRFGLFGLLAVAIDYLTMSGAAYIDLDQVVAKSFGYLAALTFTVLFLGRVVFENSPKVRPGLVASLYLLSGTVNVLTFAFLTRIIEAETQISFLAATGVSATINYTALRLITSR